ncbi:hypothetical protein PENTCL1PPCAC_12965, partial [Pristionchus entomophagus]
TSVGLSDSVDSSRCTTSPFLPWRSLSNLSTFCCSSTSEDGTGSSSLFTIFATGDWSIPHRRWQ